MWFILPCHLVDYLVGLCLLTIFFFAIPRSWTPPSVNTLLAQSITLYHWSWQQSLTIASFAYRAARHGYNVAKVLTSFNVPRLLLASRSMPARPFQKAKKQALKSSSNTSLLPRLLSRTPTHRYPTALPLNTRHPP
ncbi:hypothetical protein DM01DRAFT_168397 [Hesseltinella vesiculosa]|uniref:Uncharacterized protein n=1 Tax=Hesseltinella vesiculosa TaxID=101127 RepID=A0A1X2GR34_9FUNG|nr:hypothetical protein DM01DRAFT_168397 [Hesseltinella vesiculosa]